MSFFEKTWDWITESWMTYIVDPITSMNAMNIADVVLLAAVLFFLYRFFRNRRAGRVLVGLVVIVLFCLIVAAIGFPVLTYIVHFFASAAFFCIVVIFQPEIRDALESLGNQSFLNLGKNGVPRKRLNSAKAAIDETVSAVYAMSASHTGALIVFEGLTKLDDWARTGKVVDAKLVSYTLQNIFFEKAPLHDGAVIIRDFRIYAASCVLPSAKSKMDFGMMGTRHRAAVGLTEVSDALVVVISEQTGIVSIAQDRQLLRNVDEKTLTEMLMNYTCGHSYVRAKKIEKKRKYGQSIDEVVRDMERKARIAAEPAEEEPDDASSAADSDQIGIFDKTDKN